jgi:hypothetical protein
VTHTQRVEIDVRYDFRVYPKDDFIVFLTAPFGFDYLVQQGVTGLEKEVYGIVVR